MPVGIVSDTSTDPRAVQQHPPQSSHMTFKDLCCLFCCPPCPSSIAAKLAFMPPEPHYKLLPVEGGSSYSFQLNEPADWHGHIEDQNNLQPFYARSSRGNKIACLYVESAPGSRYTILFSHGNAVDLGQMSSFYCSIGQKLNCNIFSYDYSGYGASSGKPSEKNLYADIRAAWHALHVRYGLSSDSIILYGQSIGTVPTVDLASHHDCAAVILHSPLMSGMRVAFPDTRRTWCCDAFPSIDKIVKVRSPTLVIHGTEDEVIDFSHGLTIYERCPKPVEPLWVFGAGHNDIEMHSSYLQRLRTFINREVESHNREKAEAAASGESQEPKLEQTRKRDIRQCILKRKPDQVTSNPSNAPCPASPISMDGEVIREDSPSSPDPDVSLQPHLHCEPVSDTGEAGCNCEPVSDTSETG